MDVFVEIVGHLAWPVTVLLLVVIFRRDIRQLLPDVSRIEVAAGNNKAIVELVKRQMNVVAEAVPKGSRDAEFIKRLDTAREALDELASLSTTQSNIMMALKEGTGKSMNFRNIVGLLRWLYGSKTRDRVIRQQLAELIDPLQLVEMCKDEQFRLTEKGDQMVANGLV